MTELAGTDDFGDFRMTSGHCAYCGKTGIIVRYEPGHFKLPTHINIEYTMFGGRKGEHPKSLGITCGDYAKAHRQVAHIQDNMKVAA